MLVLKRKEGKSLVIMVAGKTVKVTMLSAIVEAVPVLWHQCRCRCAYRSV